MKPEAVAGGLSAARERAGLSQAELARRIETSRSSVIRIENGSRVPTFDLVLQWLAVTQTPLEMFVQRVSYPVTPVRQALPHADALASLTTEDAQTLRRIGLALTVAADLALDALADRTPLSDPPDAGAASAGDDQ